GHKRSPTTTARPGARIDHARAVELARGWGVVNVVPPLGRLRLTTPRPEPAKTITDDTRARPGANWSNPVRQGPGTGPLFAQTRPIPGGQVAPPRPNPPRRLTAT